MEQNTPTEILLLIFKDLNKQDLRKNISVVCRQWCRVVKDYQLVEDDIIKLNISSTSRRFKKLLRDVRHCRPFGNSLKTLKICEPFNNSSLESMQVDTIIKSCPNLKKLIIVYDAETFPWVITTRLSACNEIYFKLAVTSVKYEEPGCRRPLLIDLSKLVHYANTKLRELDVSTPFEDDDDKKRNLVFMKSDLLHANTCLLTTIKLVCPEFMITRDCLNYIITGSFPALKNLDLFVQFIYSIYKRYQIVKWSPGHENAIDWEWMRTFCSSSLKKYNICLTSKSDGRPLFAINNCQNENDIYYRGH